MQIHKIDIKNFRLLEKVDLHLEKQTTLIVGRNNSGKTSLTELFKRLLTDSPPVFRLEDFSLSVHDDFWKAFLLKADNKDENEIRQALPVIEAKLSIKYDKDTANLGLLGNFIIDLNPDCTEALIVIRYQLKDGEIDAFFEGIEYDAKTEEGSQKNLFCKKIKERISKCYSASLHAEDPHDSTNQKPMEWTQLQALIRSDFINAQRGLDDTTHKDINLLGKVLEALLSSAESDTADVQDQDLAKQLEKAVEEIQKGIDGGFNKQLLGLLPAFSLFGYPGLKDPRLITETTLDVKRLLKDHTKVHYEGTNGINLPEAYNGLGVRNLIYILLKLFEFFKDFVSAETAPNFCLIFIEEPEVHLHPQMQEVFISKLNGLAKVFEESCKGRLWPVQFIVTTHSSHLANRAAFNSMRYFLAGPTTVPGIYKTRIKDVQAGLTGVAQQDQEFLHKYMTLTRCDLLFADKAILIEGAAERLLLPKMIEKIDEAQVGGPHLSSQYLSVVEVGGAYAHLFFKLLDFLELQTLIITDLDAVDQGDGGKACLVSKSTNTSNACIKFWFNDPNVKPVDLLKKRAEEKTNGIRRITYQISEIENAPCGRSFEEAFILANPELFELAETPADQRELKASEKAGKITAKTDFALNYAIQKISWKVPRYISEGLCWLAVGMGQAVAPSSPPVTVILATEAPPKKKEKKSRV